MFKLTMEPAPIGVKFGDISYTLETFILSGLDVSIVQFIRINIYIYTHILFYFERFNGTNIFQL